MNPLLKQVIIYGLDFFIAHEATFVAHTSNQEVKKLGADLVSICKTLLPIVTAL